ncbi:MAG: metallophosphoesterase [Ignavibacteriales bacterium]|nr:metallophosphoesterase [Ignavibacteriales bacterium]
MKIDFKTELEHVIAETNQPANQLIYEQPKMKLLALSDIHGAYNEANQIIRKENPDILIIAGDLTTRGTNAEVKITIESFKQVCPIIVAVCGNMDSPSHEKVYDELGIGINAHGKIFKDVGFVGVSGSPISWMKTPYEISEDEIYQRAKNGFVEIKHCRVKIFVPHAPPLNTNVDRLPNGSHVGSSAVRKIIEELKPDICVCGHIHEARGKDVLGKTIIVNCGTGNKYYATIEIGEEIMVMNQEM